MPTFQRISLFAVAALFGLLSPTLVAAESGVTVQVASGRQFSGQIGTASTGERLVLRSTSGSMTIERSIAWDRIVSAKIDEQPADIATLRKAARVADHGVSNGSASEVRKSLLTKIELHGELPPPNPQTTEASISPRVAMIAIDPFVANWDADVETDGLVIDVAPLDINRNLIPIGGTLEVELFAPQRRSLDLVPLSGGDTLEVVERWSRAITPEDFGPSGVRLRLPFGAVHPELDSNWLASSYGLVHARLSIPGQGVFDESRDGIRVRPWAPNRDRLEQKSGQRFLPTENLGRTN
jgi:hypothetical protein